MSRLAILLLATPGLLLAQPTQTIVLTRIGPSQTGLFVANADGTAEGPLLNADGLGYPRAGERGDRTHQGRSRRRVSATRDRRVASEMVLSTCHCSRLAPSARCAASTRAVLA